METFKGTTTIGLTCKDGVVFAADRRASWGSFVASKRAKKIFNINDVVGSSVAGSVGDAESLMRLIQAEASLYAMSNNKKMSTEPLATLMANILHGNKMFPYLVQLLIAGYDGRGPKLFSLDPIGGLTEEKMAATGSGSPVAYGVLEQEYREDKTVQENVPIALKALASAMSRDSSTGDGMELAVITKQGFRQYSQDEVMDIFEQTKKR